MTQNLFLSREMGIWTYGNVTYNYSLNDFVRLMKQHELVTHILRKIHHPEDLRYDIMQWVSMVDERGDLTIMSSCSMHKLN